MASATSIVDLTESYNSLFPVADANFALAQLGGDAAVSKALSAIVDVGLEDVLGLRLLHKHNDISFGEIMVETAAYDDEGFSLVTSPSGENLKSASPNSWMLMAGRFVPVEFSEHKLLQDPNFRIEEYEEELSNLANILISENLSKVLGPCLNYSDWVKKQKPEGIIGDKFLEKTDEDCRANVLRYVSLDDPDFINSSKTKWSVNKTQSEGEEKNEGEEKTWTASCSCFCSVFPQGGHQGTKTHRYNPSAS